MKKTLLMLLTLALLALPAVSLAENEVEIGAPAPDFTLTLLNPMTDAEGGEISEFTLSQQQGKVVVINFWATWCPYCVMEMPDFEELSKAYAENVIFLGVDAGESEDVVRAYIEQNGYTYLFALDQDYALMDGAYATSGIPYTVVVDGAGNVSSVFTGAASKEQMEWALQTALDATIQETPAA